jgi:beta-glucosidase-like glycosyl hydrolase
MMMMMSFSSFSIASHCIVGFEPEWQSTPKAPFNELLRQRVGGVILFKQHVHHLEGFAGFRVLQQTLFALRKAAQQAECPWFWVGVDQEGGQVERFGSQWFPSLLSPATVALVNQQRPDFAHRHYALLAKALALLGINLNFFPTLDVQLDPQNPIIGVRAFGETAQTVWQLGEIALNAHHQAGVCPVVKHFPGHGFGTVDSHEALPVLTFTQEELSPFKQAIASRLAPMVMVSHGYYPALQSSVVPASLDPAVTTGLLRHTLGFQGISITDDLAMGAVTTTLSPLAIAQQALKAGQDCLLYRDSDGAMLSLAEALQEWLLTDASKEGYSQNQHAKSVNRLQQGFLRLSTLPSTLPPLTPETYQALQRQADALAQEASDVLVSQSLTVATNDSPTTLSKATLNPSLPLVIMMPSYDVMPSYQSDLAYAPSLADCFIQAGFNQTQVHYYQTPEEEAQLAKWFRGIVQQTLLVQGVVVTTLPKQGSTLLSLLQEANDNNTQIHHWAIGTPNAQKQNNPRSTITTLPLGSLRPPLVKAMIKASTHN